MKIEIELTPDEFKELFLPSEKQAEFAAKMGEAYFNAMKTAATTVFKSKKNEKNSWHLSFVVIL